MPVLFDKMKRFDFCFAVTIFEKNFSGTKNKTIYITIFHIVVVIDE